jgi:hypothetical protein
MKQERKLKNRQLRNIGIKVGISQRTTVKCSSLEGFKSPFLKRCCHWGIALSLTAVGVMRMTR